MKNKIKSKVIVPHSDDCFMQRNSKPFSGLTDGYFWGNWNANANAKRGNHHIWHRCTCNDSSCPAIKAVHSSVLVDA